MNTFVYQNTIDGKKDHNIVVLKLIYFWAFIEAGIGGLLHLLHIPLTGFVIGGFAVVINVLLAKFGGNKATVFMKALGIVLAVKFLLSPYIPFGAYLAVCFQGLLAAFLFSLFGLNSLTIFLFAMLVMVESGLQKPLVAFFVFGLEFWNSAVVLVMETFKTSKEKVNNAVEIFFAGYMLLYVFWGIILSRWSIHLQKNIDHLQFDNEIIKTVYDQVRSQQKPTDGVNKSRLSKIVSVVILGILVIILLVFGYVSLFSVARVIFLLILLLFIFPLLIKKHQVSLLNKNKQIVNDIITEFPAIKDRTRIAWILAQQQPGLKKIKSFVTYAIWLNVFYEQSDKI